MSKFSPNTQLGYLGGGQLARLLCQSAQNLGLTPHVMSLNSTDPAAQVIKNWHQGDPNSVNDLESFFENVDIVGFESEFLDSENLMEAYSKSKVEIYPSPKLMGTLQDRKSQKELFDTHKLPTSAWTPLNHQDQVFDFVKENKLPVVFKKRFQGYDGYGTYIVKSKKALTLFMEQQFESGLFIVEKFIPFKRESAVIIARSRDGSITNLPFVESFQKEARCDWVKGPISNKQTNKILPKLKTFLKKINYIGVMGVEFFETHSGLIINEIAPRVHNTGHYSLTTEGLSQFDLHNMCLLGLKLPKEIDIKKGFAMANLIGRGKNIQLKASDGLYWYGKSENREGRKMGHLNGLGSSPKQALKKVLKLRKDFEL